MYRLNSPTSYTYGDGKVWNAPWSAIEEVGQVVRLEPWIPNVADGPEYNVKIPRICLAPTVDQCFVGISQWGTHNYRHVEEFSGKPYDDEWYWVLEPLGFPRYECPNGALVPDFNLIDEHWILEPWDFLVIGKVMMYWRAQSARDPLEWKFVEGGFRE